MDLQAIIDHLRDWPPIVVYLLLFAGAFIEYIVPPVPGDTFVVGGAVLVSAFGWHFAPVLAVVTGGAVLGAWLDFVIGKWLVKSGRLDKFGPKGRRAIDGIVAQMKRRGAAYLAVNRFLPGIRAFFFVAAGIAGLSAAKVLFWSGLSALAWNGLLVGLGYALGANLPALESFLVQYSVVVWIVIGVVIAFFVGRMIWKARRAKTEDDPST